ncbi:MAG: cysteine hydrolase family protein [Candidatus Hodarchaeales archaeon]|jgi:nicotinamidase-related amidase
MKLGEFSEVQIKALAKKAYEEGDAGFKIIRKNCALIVIDMQDEFVKPHWTPFWIPEATRQVERINTLIVHCRDKYIPVIYTAAANTNFRLDRPTTGDLMPNRYSELGIEDPSIFREGHIWEEISPQPEDIIIHKPSYGAFYDTPLETILRKLRKDTIIICGTLSNYCCGMTARQGYERGFKVVVGSDVTSTNDPTMHEAELKVLRAGFARVLPSKEIINILNANTQ